MVRLFVDTSGDYLSIVLKRGAEVAASLRLLAGKRMSELLLGRIDGILSSSGVSIEDVDEFYAVTGPGSFTGARIGAAMVLGLSEGAGKPAYGLSSLDLAALSSGLTVLKVASPLKGDIYAMREYDFSRGVFSDFYCRTLGGEELALCVLVNAGGGEPLRLEKALESDGFLSFRGDCRPLYLRKSEAEINLDKKSGR